MSSMASRLLPWRSWNWMMFSAVCISSRSCPACAPVSHSRSMSCSSRPYLLMRCTGFSRYEDRSILSPSSCCLCCNSHHITTHKQHSIRGTTLSTDSVDAEWKICLKRTFYVSCLFINNMSSTRFYSIYNQCCYVFARSTLCLVLKSTHGLWQSWFNLTGVLCWNMQILMPLISSRNRRLPNESFIPRAPISKKMTSTGLFQCLLSTLLFIRWVKYCITR